MINLQRPSIRNYPGAVAGVTVTIGKSVHSWTLRAVDAAKAGVAFSIGIRPDDDRLFDFAAKEAWSEREVCLEEPLELVVKSAAGSSVQLIVWE